MLTTDAVVSFKVIKRGRLLRMLPELSWIYIPPRRLFTSILCFKAAHVYFWPVDLVWLGVVQAYTATTAGADRRGTCPICLTAVWLHFTSLHETEYKHWFSYHYTLNTGVWLHVISSHVWLSCVCPDFQTNAESKAHLPSTVQLIWARICPGKEFSCCRVIQYYMLNVKEVHSLNC